MPAALSGEPRPTSTRTGSTPAGSTSPPTAASSTAPAASSTPLVLTIAGENPAHIHVGDTSTLARPSPRPSKTKISASKPTSTARSSDRHRPRHQRPATDTIDYVATDTNGLTSTSTRTVIIEPTSPPASTADAATSLLNNRLSAPRVRLARRSEKREYSRQFRSHPGNPGSVERRAL